MDINQVQSMVDKESISHKFDNNIFIRNKIPNTFDVDTTPPKKKDLQGLGPNI